MRRLPVIVGLALIASACVTIHIYFPAAAAEEAARAIVREVLELPEDGANGPGAAPRSELESRDTAPTVRPRLAWLLDLVIAPAQAQAPDLRVQTPAIQRIQGSMRARNSELLPHWQSGAIGFTRDGLIAARDLSALPLRERSTVQRLVSEENADRTALYREIARANERPDWEAQIRDTFARVWVEEAPRGYWYQDTTDQWRQR